MDPRADMTQRIAHRVRNPTDGLTDQLKHGLKQTTDCLLMLVRKLEQNHV